MPAVVVFDGACSLCTGAVRFLIRHEATPSLRFASSQSPAGASLLRGCGLDPGEPNTVVLIEDGMAHTKSEAVLRLLSRLRRPWCWLRGLGILPGPLRDRVYDELARRRRQWFGAQDACRTLQPGDRQRFL